MAASPPCEKRYGRDKSLTAPILANAALAGLVPWRQVPALPFEYAGLPQKWYSYLQLPVVSYAIPVLAAVGQLKFHHDPPRNPFDPPRSDLPRGSGAWPWSSGCSPIAADSSKRRRSPRSS